MYFDFLLSDNTIRHISMPPDSPAVIEEFPGHVRFLHGPQNAWEQAMMDVQTTPPSEYHLDLLHRLFRHIRFNGSPLPIERVQFLRQRGRALQVVRQKAVDTDRHVIQPPCSIQTRPHPESHIKGVGLFFTTCRHLQQLKLSPLSPTVQSINDLPLLSMLSNRKDYTESETLDITCMGALPNMDLVGSLDTDEYPRKVAEQVITAVSGLLQASVDTLVAASDLANSIGLATNVMALHQDNEHLIQNAPVKEWRQTVNALNLKLTSGDFAPIRQLNMAITALQCLQMEAAASPAMG